MRKLLAIALLYGVATAALHADDESVATRLRTEQAEMQRQMEDAAGRYPRFPTSNVTTNGAFSEPTWPKEFYVEQSQLRVLLKKWSAHPASLQAMLRHPDPKVRTLALGSLYIREDPQDLPVIASFVGDHSPTFTEVFTSLTTGGAFGDLGEYEQSQTVGDVAQQMLEYYTRAAQFNHRINFQDYWRVRQTRKTCASWILVKLQRAGGHSSRLQQEYRDEFERVIQQVKALPVADRAWTQIFLRCFSFPSPEEFLSDADCIATLKEIGPDQVIEFLQQKRVTDDPDFWFDSSIPRDRLVHYRMAHFILKRATSILRAQDARALLRCESVPDGLRRTIIDYPSPAWAAAAAELVGSTDPVLAQRMIDDALQRFPLSDIVGGSQQAVLIASLWKIRGVHKKQRIVNWFYQAQEKVIAKGNNDQRDHGPHDLLRLVQETPREDLHELTAALVTAPGFDRTDWPVVRELLTIASKGRPEPLVSPQMADKADPAWKDPKQQELLAERRQLLIRHYQPQK